MWTLRQLLSLVIICGCLSYGYSETTEATNSTVSETTAMTNTTVSVSTAVINSTVLMTTDSETDEQTTSVAMTTAQTNTTNVTSESPTTIRITTMETTVTTMMETTTMYVSTTPLPPIKLFNCSSDSNCTFANSACNNSTGVCQCIENFVLIGDMSCTSVKDFQASIFIENVTETSILVAWNTTHYPGVEVYFTIDFNNTPINNVSSPHLIENLTDGEVHTLLITSNVTGRDMRTESVMSNVEYVRTVPRQPNVTVDPPYNAPNVTIRWEPRNPYFSMFYIYFTGPGVNFVASTSDTNKTFTGLKHGAIYSFTIVQETDEPYRRNSSALTKEFRTEPSVPNPPLSVDATAGQRNITVNINDTVMPNGNIIQYIFQLTYKVYRDEGNRHGVIILPKKDSGIYVLDSQSHIFPGAEYNISVFTVNDRFNSSTSTDITGVETFPDVPGEVYRNEVHNLTTTSGSIRWGRPVMPNGVMVAYRAILKEGPEVTCRIYQFCIAICNYTLLGPPNDTCHIQNDTRLDENQKEMSLDINNLRLGTTYTIQVIGYTTVGPGEKVEISLKTLSVVPNAIEDGAITAGYSPGNGVLNVTWSPPSFAGEDLVYTLVLRDAIKSLTLDTKSNLKDPQYLGNYQLHNFYNYTVTITPRTSAGAASISRPFSFTTRPSGRLGRPQNLKIKILRCDSVQIAWEEANVEDRNGPITGYKFQNTQGTQEWTFKVSNPNFWSISNREFSFSLRVQEKSRYSITIFAVSDRVGQSGVEYSSQVFSTEECPADNGPVIAVIVIAFLILLGICLVVIIYVYRKKVREIEEVYVHPNRGRPISITNEPIVDEDIPLDRPFILNDVQKIFEEKSADSNRLFLMEYDDIKKLSQIEGKKRTTNHANLDGNKAKNRYVNILAYDHSRVKLHLIDDDPCSDYVNANFIVGYTYEREYIASQGPLPGTVNDFWRMAWEQSATIIVMLTKCKEGNTNAFLEDKCEHYWPDTTNEPKQYGDIVVNLISVSNMDKFDINIFQVSQGDYTRTIKHFHFLEWPDFSAAVDSTVVIDFIQTVRTHITPEVKGPILIHCSAGVGRTGTYISIDYLLQYVRDHDLSQSVDIFAWVVQMRKNRVSMVQVDKQYIFIHRALVELVERKRNGLLQSNDESILTNEVVYENTAFHDEDEEEEEEEEEPDEFYENSITKITEQPLTEL
ncbi:receptor-type tyrosine-protein phosphatase beta-like isoform X2 [Saccostrea cucullata]|uniref:receptor-type tyrosine-protein phosphatase beta-like isoform X2 n=1 Tax=Saccostrea cuccullata TaxID=36930 RepID=UPI002ED538D8